MGIYLENGYLDIRAIMGYGMPFNLIVHARGTGKTYGTLEMAIEDQIKFILMRRTEKTVKTIIKPAFSPFKELNSNQDLNMFAFPEGDGSALYRHGEYDDKGKLHASGDVLGMCVALSTIATMRGVGLSDYDLLFFDEFIKEDHEKPMMNEGAAFANAYETINRNRELQGWPALRCICAANSNDLGNPLFVYLGLTEQAIKLQQSGNDFAILKDRGVGLFIPHNSPISEKKKDTALYRLTQNTEYSDMALRNHFMIEGEDTINSVNLREYKPLVTAGVLTVYEHRTEPVYFVSFHKSGSPETYKAERIELLRFKNKYMWLWGEHMLRHIMFETYSSMKIFESYFATT